MIVNTARGAAIAVALLFGACHPSQPSPPPPGTITYVNHPDGKCHEDDPCWDCHTMGNKLCSPITEVNRGR